MIPPWINDINWDDKIKPDMLSAASEGNGMLHDMYTSTRLHFDLKNLLPMSKLDIKQPASFCVCMIDFACFMGADYLSIQIGKLIVKLWTTLSMRDRTFIVYRLNAMITFREYGTNQIVVRRLGAIIALLILTAVIEPTKKKLTPLREASVEGGTWTENDSYSAKYTTPENRLLFSPYFETWARLLTQEEDNEGVRQRGRQIACLSMKTQAELRIWEMQQCRKTRHIEGELTSMPPQAFTVPKAKL